MHHEHRRFVYWNQVRHFPFSSIRSESGPITAKCLIGKPWLTARRSESEREELF
jgi:hypothetical protein